MLRRLFLVFLPSITTATSYANEASWNCEQDKDSKEWVCLGDNAQKTPATKPVTATEPAKIAVPTSQMPSQIIAPELVKPINPLELTEKPQKATPLPVKNITSEVNKSPVALPAIKPDSASISIEKESTLPETSSAWGCHAQKGDNDWNCQSNTSNTSTPSEEKANQVPQPVTITPPSNFTSPSKFSLLEPTFNAQQEDIFNTLTSKLAYDPWENCSAERGTKRVFKSTSDQRESAPLEVKSNYAEMYDNEIGDYSGNVKMSRADQQSSSEKANYNRISQVLDLHGNVYYREDEVALHTESATLNLTSDEAKIRDTQFIAASTPIRGSAKLYHRQSKTLSSYKDVAYTSCKPGNQDWVIHSSDMTIDKSTGRGTAKNAWMEFKGAPVLYTPYLAFPIDNRRTSGFLMPSFGNTKYSGFRLAAPYYWNIAPNYDATITPRELIKRGPLLAGNFRYLTEQSKGNVAVEFMPHDLISNQSRYSGKLKNTSTITPNIRSNMDLNYVSDKTYFSELGSALTFSNYNYLKSSADIGYVREGVSLNTSFVNYQSINTTLVSSVNPLPYRILPRVNLNLDHSFKFMPLDTAIENEYVYFQHNEFLVDKNGQTDPALTLLPKDKNLTPSGQRFNTKPIISMPLQTASTYIKPKLSLQHTQYLMSSGQPIYDNQSIIDTTGTSVSRTLPIFSTDSGLYFDRNLSLGNNHYTHTIEPRLFYLYVPYTNQQNLPVFDTAQYDFTYSSMFRENSFSGTDRIQDANQVTTAVTSRFIDESTGLERLKVNVGEIFYFRNRQVTTPYSYINTSNTTSTVPLGYGTDSQSNLVTELSSEFTRNWSATSGLQWNPQSNAIQRLNGGLHFANKNNEIFNIGYLYRRIPLASNNLQTGLLPSGVNDINQTDTSFRYPIYDNWTAMGRWQYSLLYNTTQDALIGVEKENCCWRFRIALRHYINNIANNNTLASNATNTYSGTAQNGVFFEIELKGLSALGDDMDTFLRNEIYGYRGSRK